VSRTSKIQKAGYDVRINAQLIDASTSAHIWAERYKREYRDIFKLQEDIVQDIVAKLAIKTIKCELAIKEAQRAIELNPNDSGSYNELGWAYLCSGQLDEAVVALEMALRLDRSSPRNIWWHLGISYYLKERYEEAMHIREEGLIKRPNFVGYHIALAATYARLGQNEKAAQSVASIHRLDPFFSIEAFGTGFRQPAHRDAIVAGLREAGMN
jgi:adenylate cyclase